MKNVITWGEYKYIPREIGEFAEGYALAKIDPSSLNGKSANRTTADRTILVVINESNQVVESVDDDVVVWFLVSKYEPITNDVFARVDELKKTAKIGSFKNGIAEIKISTKSFNQKDVESTYYVTRSGLVLCEITSVDGKLLPKARKKMTKLEYAKKLWNDPKKFKSLRTLSGFEETSLISKMIDNNKPKISSVRAYFDIASHSMDEKYKQAQKDLENGIITQDNFAAEVEKLKTVARKNQDHMLEHERRAGTIDSAHLPIRGFVDNLSQNITLDNQ